MHTGLLQQPWLSSQFSVGNIVPQSSWWSWTLQTPEPILAGSRLRTRAYLLGSLICLCPLTFSFKLMKICQDSVLENPIFPVGRWQLPLSGNYPSSHAHTHTQTKQNSPPLMNHHGTYSDGHIRGAVCSSDGGVHVGSQHPWVRHGASCFQ